MPDCADFSNKSLFSMFHFIDMAFWGFFINSDRNWHRILYIQTEYLSDRRFSATLCRNLAFE